LEKEKERVGMTLRNSVVNLSDVAARVLNNRLGEGFSVSNDVRQRIKS